MFFLDKLAGFGRQEKKRKVVMQRKGRERNRDEEEGNGMDKGSTERKRQERRLS